jgi:hypothetical protein
MAARRPAERTAGCAHCGETFNIQSGPGPEPIYCSPAHRQRAYELRRRTGRSEEEQAMAAELQASRARVGVLEYENKQLRQTLAESTNELISLRNELHPPSEAVRHLLETPHAATPRPAVAESSPRPRRWLVASGSLTTTADASYPRAARDTRVYGRSK